MNPVRFGMWCLLRGCSGDALHWLRPQSHRILAKGDIRSGVCFESKGFRWIECFVPRKLKSLIGKPLIKAEAPLC